MASWKPKDKPLTREEAISLARRDLARYWLGSEPLLAGVRQEGACSVHPLDDGFASRPWLVALVDPTSFTGESVFAFTREWARRFRQQELGVLVFFRPGFKFTREEAFLQGIARRFQLSHPVVADPDGALCEAFGAKGASEPRLLLIRGGKVAVEIPSEAWPSGAETEIQRFLRQVDPGLALAPSFEPVSAPLMDRGRIEFGSYAGYPKPGFVQSHGAVSTAVFRKGAVAPREGELAISGAWVSDGERLITSDRTAEIRLRLAGTHLNIVAMSMATTAEYAEVAVAAGGEAPYDGISGDDLIRAETGEMVFKAHEPRVYHALRDLPATLREVTLTFPAADRVPVGLFGIRVGSSARALANS